MLLWVFTVFYDIEIVHYFLWIETVL
jgi:hypothetical protein